MDEAVKIQISTAIAERFFSDRLDDDWTRDEKVKLMKTAYEVLGDGICHRCTRTNTDKEEKKLITAENAEK